MTRQSRREFLEYSMLSAASAAVGRRRFELARAAPPKRSPRGSTSPNEKLGVAIVGMGDRGRKTHLPILLAGQDVEILWLVDPDEEHGQKAVE